jgi:hypothetical protein
MDLDAGIAYNNAPKAIQRLLDKVKARKKAAGETETNQLSARLDELIEFARQKPFKEGPVRIFPPPVKSIGNSPLGLAVRKKRNELLAYRKLTPHIEDIAKGLERFRLSSKLDELIQFATLLKPHKYTRALGLGQPFSGTRKLLGIGAIGIGAGIAGAGAYRLLDKRYERNRARKELGSLLDNLIQFQTDPRPRNPLGEFTGQEEGGPDPNAMVKTYRIAPAQPGMAPNKSGILGASALTVLGGAGGALGGKIGGAAWDKIGSALKRVKKK